MDTAKFALFVMLFNVVYKGVLCLLRACGSHNDKLNAPIAGFLSALSISFDAKSRRMLFTILTLSKAIDASVTKVESNTGKMPYKDIVFWVIAN